MPNGPCDMVVAGMPVSTELLQVRGQQAPPSSEWSSRAAGRRRRAACMRFVACRRRRRQRCVGLGVCVRLTLPSLQARDAPLQAGATFSFATRCGGGGGAPACAQAAAGQLHAAAAPPLACQAACALRPAAKRLGLPRRTQRGPHAV